jgi:hypothetical protein
VCARDHVGEHLMNARFTRHFWVERDSQNVPLAHPYYSAVRKSRGYLDALANAFNYWRANKGGVHGTL